MESISDNTLMLKVKAGDNDKLGLLFERYKKQLFGFFYMLTKNIALSEDLVQNVFYRILKYKKQFRGEGKFTTWMYSISRNVLADHYRKEGRRGEAVQISDQLLVTDEAATAIDKEEDIRQLQEALLKLDENKREMLIMNRYQGIKYKQMADIYNTNETAMRVKVFRIINELRTIYQQLEKSGEK